MASARRSAAGWPAPAPRTSSSPAAAARTPPAADALRADLEELGARVEIVACDAADRDALAAVLAAVPDELPLTGVVHTAGVGQYGPLDGLTPAEFAELTSAKLAGAAHLDELLGDRALDLFVLFGSVAGVWGSGGQSAYGAANAYLDALAEHRRARGLAATSVAWGPWAEAGMATDEAVSGALQRQGLGLLESALAMTELRRAVVQGRHHRHRRRRRLGPLRTGVHLGPPQRAARRPAGGTGTGRRGRRRRHRRHLRVRHTGTRPLRARADPAPVRPRTQRGRVSSATAPRTASPRDAPSGTSASTH